MDEPRIANTESEIALLAHILRCPSEYTALADIVKPCDFSWECFSWAWQAMARLVEDGKKIEGKIGIG